MRWYLRYALSYRDLEEMMRDRGVSVDHMTVYRWVQRYAPELDKRCRPHLKETMDSYRVDETYIKVKGQWNISTGPSIKAAWQAEQERGRRGADQQERRIFWTKHKDSKNNGLCV